MSSPAPIGEAFRLLRSGDALAALEVSRQLIGAQATSARAHLAAGLALRMLGRLDESRAAIEEAARLDPADYGAAYEMGVALAMQGHSDEALACFDRAVELRPTFVAAHYAAGMQRFERREWAGAVRSLESAAALDSRSPEVLINLAQALAEIGHLARAEGTLEQVIAMHPGLATARHAMGWVLHKAKRTTDAVTHLQAAVASHPDPDWRVDLGKALADLGRDGEAREQFERVLAAAPNHRVALVTFGRFCVRLGDFDRAAELFRAALEIDPANIELPMYLAQVELLRGHWRAGWEAYGKREQRLRFEAQRERLGAPYRLPTPEGLRGKRVLLTGEQGLGDELFFLRFAPALRDAGARLAYAGEARLRSLLERTGLFDQVLAFGDELPEGAIALLTGDLPLVAGPSDTPPSLAIAPDGAKLETMRRRLERAGPRPWIGLTWRAGTDPEVISHALHKAAPITPLFAALPRDGTVISLQRDGRLEELETASRALGRPIHDFSAANADLEEALALTRLLDRHVGVSNTNMHLAAAAGAKADVLVPFPPEWRWGIEGDSIWFPGFRVFRQAADGDWSRAFAALASAGPGSASRA